MQPNKLTWCGPDLKPFQVEIITKKIKHIYFKVYPSPQKIIISVPHHLTQQEWERAVLSKQAWLLKQVNRPGHGVAAADTWLSHDRIRLKGVLYPVSIVSTQSRVTHVDLEKNGIQLFLTKPLTDGQIQTLLGAWVRDRLLREIGRLVAIWEPRLGVSVAQYRVREMKTRWGSCNIRARRIWINLALVHLSEQFLEYVVVHEMVHLLERRHNDRFKSYLNTHVPDWRQLKMQMNQISL